MNRFGLAGLLCVISAIQCFADFTWVTSVQGDSSFGVSIAADHHGNSFVVGNFSGTVSFGSKTLTSAGGSDVFVAKVDRKGEVCWTISLGGTNDDSAYKILATPDGTLFVTGFFGENAGFASTQFQTNGLSGGFLAKFTTEGRLEWINLLTSVAAQTAFLAPDQQVWFVGAQNGFRSFSAWNRDGEQSATIVTESSEFTTVALAVDRSGAFYVSGNGQQWSLPRNFALKFDRFGQIEWQTEAVSAYRSFGVALAVSPTRMVSFVGNGDYDGFPLHGQPSGYRSPGLFIARWSSAGNSEEVTWIGEYKGAYHVNGIALDRHGEAHVAAHFNRSYVSSTPYVRGGLVVGPHWKYEITNAFVSRDDAYLPIEARAIAVDPFGFTYVSGDFASLTAFGTNVIGERWDFVSHAFVTRLDDGVHRPR